VGFPDRRAGTQERIEDGLLLQVVRPVGLRDEIGPLGQRAAEQDAAEDRPEPTGPPLVDVVNRPVDLVAPALALCEAGVELEREFISLDEPRVSH
jgi:hypothetical protein